MGNEDKVKQLKSQIEAVEGKIAALEGKLAELEEKRSALAARLIEAENFEIRAAMEGAGVPPGEFASLIEELAALKKAKEEGQAL